MCLRWNNECTIEIPSTSWKNRIKTRDIIRALIVTNTTIASIYDITSPSGVSQIARIKGFARWNLSKVDIFFYFSFFRLERARPPCQCADVLNWLVILIEFHYTPGGQSLGAGFKCTLERVALIHGCAARAHARTHARNARQKPFHGRLSTRRFKKRR